MFFVLATLFGIVLRVLSVLIIALRFFFCFLLHIFGHFHLSVANMPCSYNGCKLENSKERLISCWLCDNLSHLCCAGFNGRHYDAICDRNKGLRWSCWDCRQLDVDFYKLFREAKRGISELKKVFHTTHEKILRMEDMFKNFNISEKTPKKKKSTLTVNDNVGTITSPLDSNLISLFSPIIDVNDSQSQGLSSDSSGAQISTAVIAGNPVDVANPVVSKTSGAQISSADVIVDGNPVDVANPEPLVTNVPTNPCSSIVNPTNQTDNSIPAFSLVVVPPRRTIFLSRLSPTTSTDNIRTYIKSKCVGLKDNDFNVLKFNYSEPRDIASFKIFVPDRIFDTLVNKSTWPEGTLVKEFIRRERIISEVSRHPPDIVVSKN